MSISKSQIKATQKYVKNNYDEIKLRIPKGKKQIIKNHVIKNNYKSVNNYIIKLISDDIGENF